MRIDGLRTRTLLLAAGLAVAFAGVTVRLAHLQLVQGPELAARAERQHSRTVVVPAQRGPILDRHGTVLATSGHAESLFAHPRGLGDPVRAAARLAPILGLPERQLHLALTGGRPFVWLARRLPPETVELVRALREPGLGFLPEPARVYPHHELAAHVIGFEGTDGGLEGVEGAWDEVLAGKPGKVVVDRDALGRDLSAQEIVETPAAGQGVRLTLDARIQHLAEREIEAAYRRTRAKGAMAVVLDPRTGDVLALAIRPTFDPNAFRSAPRESLRNRAITDPFEPGSTFKVILAAAALEERVVRPEDRIYAENGAITVANATIRDWKKFGWLSFAEVLQNSSNVGSIKVGLSLGAQRYHRYMTSFGFGAPTGVGLPGESRGLLRDPSRWSGLSLPTLSIGQEVSVTALQIVAAFGAVANEGLLMRPRIVQATLDAEGREVRRLEPTAVRRVISAATARTLAQLLVRVVEEGTGHNAAIPGYAVGGKTGTAQKRDPVARRYSRAPGVLSFVGFAPVGDPRFVMLVMLDEPRNEKWGSEAAAPIFAAIGREILRYLGVPPRDATPVPIVTTAASEPAGPAIVLVGGPSASPPPAQEAATGFPDLRGQSLRQALTTLAPLDVGVEIAGRGLVVAQAPPPGTPAAPATIVRLTLAPAAAAGTR